jgi:LuxR family transcriptional regulator, maltose regulon positive regulatory protein
VPVRRRHFGDAVTSESSPRDPALLLKSTPPRGVRHFLDRERLKLNHRQLGGVHATALLAPVGFGKTTQLAHWQRQAMARSALTIWYTVDIRDDPQRLMRGLTYSAQTGSGKRAFAEPFMKWIENRADPVEAATGWLAEIAELAVDVLLLLDDVDLLPSSTRTQVLTYLLGNAPANLHIALAARPTSALMASGILTMAPVTRVMASDLQFRNDETLAVLSAALGTQRSLEASVRLHELTEGWPLGVQLAVAALQRSGDLEGLLAAATADIRRYFIDTAIDRQTTQARHLLVCLAQFDVIHPDLCAVVLGGQKVSQELLRLQDETPLLLRAEGSDWMRLHPLAREVLRERLAELAPAERQAMSRKAATWYAEHDLSEEAAQHAFFAGDVKTAISLVERSTYRMTILGRSATVLDWYQRLSPKEIDEHPGFWAPVAWALAMSERHAEAQPFISRILAQPDLPAELRAEASLISSIAAAFADRVEVQNDIYEQWPQPPPSTRVAELNVWINGRAFLEVYGGRPEQARLQWSRVGGTDQSRGYSPVSSGFANYGSGLSYLWEGRYVLAEQVLRPALGRAEHRLGRHNPVTCMVAALLAEACCESGRGDEARALLAGRLDTIEYYGLPDAIIATYKTLARAANQEGRQDQAIDLLDALRAIGRARAMPRLQVAATGELVRLHARHGRAETAQKLSTQLDAFIRNGRHHWPVAFVPWLELHAHLARAHAALAYQDSALPRALQAAECAASSAATIKRDGDAIEAQFLRAEALCRQGAGEAHNIRREAISLAEVHGMVRLLREQGARRDASTSSPSSPADKLTTAASPEQLARNTGLLTAKEGEVLTLLTRSLSNKEIALALSISEQTVKWHIKNVFNKLNAASRKHAVARARLLGLID